MIKSVAFNGCSQTYGEAFDENVFKKCGYPSLVASELNALNICNYSVPGSSNYLTFLRSAELIQSKKYNLVLTQWSALNRVWFFPGPDTEFCASKITNSDYEYRDIYFSKRQCNRIRDDITVLNDNFRNILELSQYCEILNALAKHTNTQSYYINAHIEWKDDIFKSLKYDDLSNEFSTYTKKLLDFNNRSDSELISFHKELSTKLKSLDQTKWVNLFESWSLYHLDKASDNKHPGVKSHKWLSDRIINFLKSKKM